MKIGTKVRYTKDYLQWEAEHSDEMFGYPNGIRQPTSDLIATFNRFDRGDPKNVQDQLSDYFMHRYSFERDLTIDGVIVGNNGYTGEEFAYYVWVVNELGESLNIVEPKNLIKL